MSKIVDTGGAEIVESEEAAAEAAEEGDFGSPIMYEVADEDEDEKEIKDGGEEGQRVYVSNVHEAPGDKVVHFEEDKGLYYVEKSLEKADWVPYQGPRGGEGWQNTESGEVVYDEEPPGDVDIDPVEYHEADTEELLSAVESVTGEELDDEWRQMSANELREAIQELASPEQMAGVMEELGDTEEGLEFSGHGEELELDDLESEMSVVVEVDGEEYAGNVMSVKEEQTVNDVVVQEGTAYFSTESGEMFELPEVDEVYAQPDDYISGRWQEVVEDFDSEEAPDELDITEADEMGSLLDYGIVGGADAGNMHIAEKDGEKLFLRQADDGDVQSGVQDVYDELGVTTPDTYFDDDTGTLVSEGLDMETLDEVDDVDSGELVDAMAVSLLVGNDDIGPDNVMVGDGGGVAMFDFDQAGKEIGDGFDKETFEDFVEISSGGDIEMWEVVSRAENIVDEVGIEDISSIDDAVGDVVSSNADAIMGGVE